MIAKKPFILEPQPQGSFLGGFVQAGAEPLAPTETESAFGGRVEHVSDKSSSGVRQDVCSLT